MRELQEILKRITGNVDKVKEILRKSWGILGNALVNVIIFYRPIFYFYHMYLLKKEAYKYQKTV